MAGIEVCGCVTPKGLCRCLCAMRVCTGMQVRTCVNSSPPPPQTYTADPHMIWTDVREWVMDNYPWQQSMNVSKLRTLNPEDVGWNHGKPTTQNKVTKPPFSSM